MQLVVEVPGPGRGVGEERPDDLGPAPAGPDEDVAVLLAAPDRVGPGVDRVAAELDLLLAAGVAEDRVAGRLAPVEFQEPLATGLGGRARAWSSGACPIRAGRRIRARVRRMGRRLGAIACGVLRMESTTTIIAGSAGEVNEILRTGSAVAAEPARRALFPKNFVDNGGRAGDICSQPT